MRNHSVLSPTRRLSRGLPRSAVTGQGRTILREGWSAGSGAGGAGTTPHICAHVWDGSPDQAPLVLQKLKFSGGKGGNPAAGLPAWAAHLLGQLMRGQRGAPQLQTWTRENQVGGRQGRSFNLPWLMVPLG